MHIAGMREDGLPIPEPQTQDFMRLGNPRLNQGNPAPENEMPVAGCRVPHISILRCGIARTPSQEALYQGAASVAPKTH